MNLIDLITDDSKAVASFKIIIGLLFWNILEIFIQLEYVVMIKKKNYYQMFN